MFIKLVFIHSFEALTKFNLTHNINSKLINTISNSTLYSFKTIIMMKFSIVAVPVLASTALFSVTSAAGFGGVRGGSIDDQTQTRRSLDAVCMANNCHEGCWMPEPNLFGQGTDKCQKINFFNPNPDPGLLTEADCDSLIRLGYADRWCK